MFIAGVLGTAALIYATKYRIQTDFTLHQTDLTECKELVQIAVHGQVKQDPSLSYSQKDFLRQYIHSIKQKQILKKEELVDFWNNTILFFSQQVSGKY